MSDQKSLPGPSENPKASNPLLHGVVSYILLLVCGATAFLLIRHFGYNLNAPLEASTKQISAAVNQSNEQLLHVLLAVAVVITASRAIGYVFRYLHQPPVIGEVVAGILLGPSFVGAISPQVQHYLLPPSIAPSIGTLAQVGVVVYMFLVGIELDMAQLQKNARVSLTISHSSIVIPFILGAGLALILYPKYATQDVSFEVFALFIGVSLSVTAFPVLARILSDLGLSRTPLGVTAIHAAAVGDVTAWCLLAFVVSVAQSKMHGALSTVALTGVFIAVMLGVIRPIVKKLVEKCEDGEQLPQNITASVFVALLLSALVTEYIGIHAIFGAFVLGLVIPHESVLARELTRKLEDFVVIFLLPPFFAFTGMRTQIGLVNSLEDWLYCVLIIAVACVGKVSGTALPAKWFGQSWRESLSLGILMNTRGLMELIVLNIGLDLGVISPTVFTMLVIMALLTTLITTPALKLVRGSISPTP